METKEKNKILENLEIALISVANGCYTTVTC